MDRTKAQKILEACGKPTFKIGESTLSFARQTNDSLSEIESKTDDELITHWKSLVFLNDIVGQVSIGDLQRISLIELEMDTREGIDSGLLKSWYEAECDNFDEEEYYGA